MFFECDLALHGPSHRPATYLAPAPLILTWSFDPASARACGARPPWHGSGDHARASFAVPFRGSESVARMRRADEHPPELHAGVAAADGPLPARLGGAVARHVLRRDLPDRRRPDRGDVMPHRHRLSPRRLRRSRRHLVFRPDRPYGGEHFCHFQPVPPRIPAAKFLRLQAACPAHDPALERDAHLPVDARLSRADQRRVFAGWILLFYIQRSVR